MRVAIVATAVCLSMVGLSAAQDAKAAMRMPTSIPPQSLGSALQVFAQSREIQVLYFSGVVGELRTSGASGDLTVDEALTQLLSGTTLTYRYVDDKAVTILAAATEPAAPKSTTPPQESTTSSDDSANAPRKNSAPLDEVVVTGTGTRIKGADVSSPVLSVTQEDMRAAGHTNLGDVIRALPQNFSGGQNPGVAGGANAASPANFNSTGASSLNLRGLGLDATLTLLNGTRLPYDGFRQATDISVIPVAAIDRMEVLLDGASAIYGSDAIGGVANIILKRDYEGAEVSARYGQSTDGGYGQTQYTAVGGTQWNTGGFLLTGDVSHTTAIHPGDRDYLAYIPGQQVDTVFPYLAQKGSLLSGHQRLGERAELTLDAFYTHREQQDISQISDDLRGYVKRKSNIWGIAPALSVVLPGEWSLRANGVIGRNNNETAGTNNYLVDGSLYSVSGTLLNNKSEAAGLEAEGRLFALPGGDARVSLGASYRRSEFASINAITRAIAFAGEGKDSSRAVYGEINLPLISHAQDVPFVERLALNGAVRHENYQTFGGTTTPKAGVIWTPVHSLDVKASWGRSFKTPTLYEQFSPRALYLYPSEYVGGPAHTATLLTFGGNPSLGPERAEVTTAGFDFHPDFLPGFDVELGWYDIDYTDRVGDPLTPLTSALVNPAFAEFVTHAPTPAQQNALFAEMGFPAGTFSYNAFGPYDPATVVAIARDQFINASVQHAHGVDLTTRYHLQAWGGRLGLSANVGWIESNKKLTTLAPESATSGVAFFPPKVRGRVAASWSRDRLTVSSTVNYTDGVKNVWVTPTEDVASMTTVDVVVDYQWASSFLGDIGLNLTSSNLFNIRPPYLQPNAPYYVSFDSTNYSALGRVVSATVTKKF
jgi:iron complex outermembrane recepter protein